MEVVEFLKKPERFTAVGARIPKGVLLVGPPGTGKTLLAKAIAGEAGVPFFSISGSEFVEMFVGVGASRVRDLFKKAKENAPALSLLMKLMLLGVKEELVTVDVPDIRGRTEILKVHAGNKKFDSDVSLEVIAMRTPGFSGADLANLLNEAAILAGRRGKTAISSKEIDDSIDRIVAGMEGTVMTDGKSKSLVAYHEVGHAICGMAFYHHKLAWPLAALVTVIELPHFEESDSASLYAFQYMLLLHSLNFLPECWVSVEELRRRLYLGEPEVTTGAAGDLQQITGLAKQVHGHSWTRLLCGDVIMRMMARNSMSEKLAEDIDAAVKRISDSAYKIALSHIRNNREAMDKIVDVLLEKETMTGDEFRAILSEFVEIPAENRVPPAPAPVTV
ncbi:UNVERIFIED_CONTAM: ATP-dependent zinc metalloprotease FTSH 2, chloroplastic [Sesamum radiatum]|uniref:ATP-dependent zinc metalloprotease FTSH, chloroplastic n=1 Tax=Sesamum radiatum TaxID=300843 RepID=A0AAW2T4M7_SESRA